MLTFWSCLLIHLRTHLLDVIDIDSGDPSKRQRGFMGSLAQIVGSPPELREICLARC